MNTTRIFSALPLLSVSALTCLSGWLPDGVGALRSALAVFALVFAAGVFGPLLAPHIPKLGRWIVGLVSLLAAQSLLQTLWYYVGGHLGAGSDGMSLGLSIAAVGAIALWRPARETNKTELDALTTQEITSATCACIAAGAACLFIVVSALNAASTQTTNSPWSLLPTGFFVAIATLGAAVFLAAQTSRKQVVATLTAVCLFIVASLTILLYPLGYGFDGFLHRASEQVILETGTLEPAPPSYIGQYTLVTWLNRVLHLPVSTGDTWLIGMLSLLLPLAVWHLLPGKQGRMSFLALLLALPLSIMAATTPQHVAYLLGLLALLWLIPAVTHDNKDTQNADRIHVIVPALLTTWSLAIHPLAGLPFAFIALAVWLRRLEIAWLRRAITGLLLIGGIVAVPLAFAARAWAQSGVWDWNWVRDLGHIGTWLVSRLHPPATHLALWPDWANWQSYLAPFALLGMAVLATVKQPERRRLWITTILFSLGAGASSWLLQTSGDFSFLISYERQDYAARLLIVAQLFLIPAALVGWSDWFNTTEKAHPRLRIASLLLALAWFSANVYNALPRHDAAMIGHGWSVGQSDLEAVQFIDKQADGKPYTVLANQTVSAAAVSRFGFKRYVGDVFYYPIPTGGPLYEQFLQMMNQPSQDIAQEAGALGKSDLVYVVVNNYWWRSEQVTEQLKGIANRIWNVERGNAYIFLFDLKSPVMASSTKAGL